MSKRVIVTGGAGYIGSHVCQALAQAGFEPVTVDSLENGYEWAVQWGPLERLDIRDADALDGAFRRHRPIAVMNFAAYIQVGESFENVLDQRSAVGALPAPTRSSVLGRTVAPAPSASGFFPVADEDEA